MVGQDGVHEVERLCQGGDEVPEVDLDRPRDHGGLADTIIRLQGGAKATDVPVNRGTATRYGVRQRMFRGHNTGTGLILKWFIFLPTTGSGGAM